MSRITVERIEELLKKFAEEKMRELTQPHDEKECEECLLLEAVRESNPLLELFACAMTELLLKQDATPFQLLLVQAIRLGQTHEQISQLEALEVKS